MSDLPSERRPSVFDRTGQPAWITPEIVDPEKIMLRLEGGQQVAVPRLLLQAREDGSYTIPVAFSSFLEPTFDGQARVFPLIAEHVQIEKRKVDTARVLVHKRIEEHEQKVEEPIWSEEMELKRVPVNKVVDEVPLPRQEGEAFVIPLVEEVLVIEKKILLREEVHVLKERRPKDYPQSVVLRKEVIEVERIPLSQEDETESEIHV